MQEILELKLTVTHIQTYTYKHTHTFSRNHGRFAGTYLWLCVRGSHDTRTAGGYAARRTCACDGCVCARLFRRLRRGASRCARPSGRRRPRRASCSSGPTGASPGPGTRSVAWKCFRFLVFLCAYLLLRIPGMNIRKVNHTKAVYLPE